MKNLNYARAFEEYRKRLSKDVKFSDFPSADYVIEISATGVPMSSEEFAGLLRELELQGKSKLQIRWSEPSRSAELSSGSARGRERDEAARAADFFLRLIDFDVDPELSQVLLIEQIYRAYRILANSSYHK